MLRIVARHVCKYKSRTIEAKKKCCYSRGENEREKYIDQLKCTHTYMNTCILLRCLLANAIWLLWSLIVQVVAISSSLSSWHELQFLHFTSSLTEFSVCSFFFLRHNTYVCGWYYVCTLLLNLCHVEQCWKPERLNVWRKKHTHTQNDRMENGLRLRNVRIRLIIIIKLAFATSVNFERK